MCIWRSQASKWHPVTYNESLSSFLSHELSFLKMSKLSNLKHFSTCLLLFAFDIPISACYNHVWHLNFSFLLDINKNTISSKFPLCESVNPSVRIQRENKNYKMPDCLFLFSTFNTSNHKTRYQLLFVSLRVIQVLSDEGPSTVPQSSIDGIPKH